MPIHQPKFDAELQLQRHIIAAYQIAWQSFGEPLSAFHSSAMSRHLHVVEFGTAGCDPDELREAFLQANAALTRGAYQSSAEPRHFAIGYVVQSAGFNIGIVRALTLVNPRALDHFSMAAQTVSRGRSGLSVQKLDHDDGDPDAPWRWLSEGIVTSGQWPAATSPLALVPEGGHIYLP
jgi:hypothetical protein